MQIIYPKISIYFLSCSSLPSVTIPNSVKRMCLSRFIYNYKSSAVVFDYKKRHSLNLRALACQESSLLGIEQRRHLGIQMRVVSIEPFYLRRRHETHIDE